MEVTFIGSRPRTKEVLQRRMYQTDIQKWLAEEDENEGTVLKVLFGRHCVNNDNGILKEFKKPNFAVFWNTSNKYKNINFLFRSSTINDNNLKRGSSVPASHPPARQREQPPDENRVPIVELNTFSTVPQADVHLGRAQELMMGYLRMGLKLATSLT